MSEYINKQQAIDLIESMIADKGVAFNPHKLAMALKDMESVEIVHCKDCENNDANCRGDDNWCYKFGINIDDDDYCNYGEKQVTGKLENPDDSLLTEDSEACKEQKSKLESDLISRQAIEYHTQLEARGNGQYEEVEVAYKSAIESLPPVEPKPACEDAISRQDAIEALDHINIPTQAQREYAIEIFEDIPQVEPKIYGNEHNCMMTIFGECSYPETGCGSCEVVEKVRNALKGECPPVEPKRPKGEWISCSEPPKDRRNVFLAHGTNDFKSCCIGHYEQGMGWYEDRNFFAKPIYDCKYWCDVPDLPDMGDNQFDMRGENDE